MKTILRNFVNVLRRFKMASFLNVIGLTVALTAFLVIMMQVQYERTFDRCYPTAFRICRVDMNHGEGDIYASVIPQALANAAFTSSPHIEAYTLLNSFSSKTYVNVGEEMMREVLKNYLSLAIRISPKYSNLLWWKEWQLAWKIRKR